jgi:hypothetical protein
MSAFVMMMWGCLPGKRSKVLVIENCLIWARFKGCEFKETKVISKKIVSTVIID